MKDMSLQQSQRKGNKLEYDQKNERKESVIERKTKKEGEEGQITSGLPWLSGAVRFNLVWAGSIAKEQWLGESPGRLAFPACLACRQPLFVLLALFSPLDTTSPHPPIHSPPPWKKHNGATSIRAERGYKRERRWSGEKQRQMKERWERDVEGVTEREREIIEKQTDEDGDQSD